MNWKGYLLAVTVGLSAGTSGYVQAEDGAKQNHNRQIDTELSIDTKHRTTIAGERVEYRAQAGMQPVWDEEGDAIATLQYTYYTRTDTKNNETRPLLISFNGGPGSASVWMHIAYTGPKILNVDDEGYPVQPYGLKSNPYSVLDVADIVYVNPVNTGYSRILPNEEGEMPSKEEQKKMFFGVNADVEYLAEWINTFVSRHNRWRSPKYLIGESYGTTRVSGLALALQNQQWMYLNGVILVSPTELGISRDGVVEAANRLPYFAAAAWHHKKLPEQYQNMELEAFLEQVETFTLEKLTPALSRGGFISKKEKQNVIRQMARYSGISETAIARNNLDVSTWFFWKELLRDEGKTIGRLDSRYLGIDKQDTGDRPDYNAELSSWLHSFTPAINYYLKNELKFDTDVKYNMFGPVHPWDRSDNSTGENLRAAMAANPYLNVMIQSGYYDGATNYFDAKYTMWQLDPSGKMKDRLSFKGYRSGHMMYLRKEDLKTANEHIREFISATTPKEGQPARYQR
ncbi:carboxypeptidase [Salinimonas sp. HHU 13199]|uniref:Carboxypeptidase n=1 Tax=Salinimonas profundi TaxID=2729140 RepID=A0ABR8LK67_9ALTE|nr:carboxypeptidase [Salinimonas profundi]MBD3586591.1 carboxypeptidase [Salinimonas profundi]